MSAWGAMTRRYRVQEYCAWDRLWAFVPGGAFDTVDKLRAFVDALPGARVYRFLRTAADRPPQIIGYARSESVAVAVLALATPGMATP